jgi:enoyl-CoA hydratase
MTDSVLTETHGRVGLIRFNRPEAMNALNADVVAALAAAIDDFEANPDIGCLVLTGSDTVFAAGADIGFMKDFSYLHAYRTDFVTTGGWERLKTTRKPVIAAVAGFALGGGCEQLRGEFERGGRGHGQAAQASAVEGLRSCTP